MQEQKKVTFIKTEDVEYKIKYLRLSEGKMFTGYTEEAIDGAQYSNSPINAKYQVSKDYWLQKIESKLHTINGKWDLTMIGAERLDIEHQYHQETSGIELNTQSHSGVYVQQGSLIFQLHICFESDPPLVSGSQSDDYISDEERRNLKIDESNIDSILKRMRPRRLNPEQSYPAKSLGEQDHVLMVRSSEVTRFIQSLEGTPQEAKRLHDKERTTFLVLLGSILKKVNFDINERGISGKIQRATESNNTPVSEEKIRTLLPDIKDAIERKLKE